MGAATPTAKICESRYTSLYSNVMGCIIKVSFPMRSPLVELAETLLATIEGFFSTCMIDQVLTREPRLDIEITADDDDEIGVSHTLDDSGPVLNMQVMCSAFTADKLNVSGQGLIQKWLRKFLIEVFAHTLIPKDVEKTFDTMLGDDRALERSVSFGACFGTQQNILGTQAVEDIKSLSRNQKLVPYKLQRLAPWDSEFTISQNTKPHGNDYKPGEGEPPQELLDKEKLSHKDYQVRGLIKPRLWDKAAWCGVGFATYPNGSPGLILLYEDSHAAMPIFEDLRNELGAEDQASRLRVSIVRHINKKFPSHYRVCLTESPGFSTKKTIQVTARLNTMTPLSEDNLNNFLTAYEEFGKYSLSFASQQGGNILPPSKDVMIVLSKLNVMEAWEVGLNHIEMMAISKEDDPIIPAGIENPPVSKVMNRRSQ